MRRARRRTRRVSRLSWQRSRQDDLERSVSSLSLRDHAGNAHITIEVDVAKGRVLQFQGKQNKEPIRRYVDAIAPYLASTGWEIGQITADSLHFFDEGYRVYHLDDMPSGTTVRGNVSFDSMHSLRFPADMTVTGFFAMQTCDAVTLPKRMKVGTHFTLKDSSDIGMPERLEVGGYAVLVDCRDLAKIADEVVANKIKVSGSTLGKIADRIEAAETVQVIGSRIASFGNLETVPLDLTFIDCSLPELPVGMRVPRDLVIEKCRTLGKDDDLTLPSSLSVGRDVVISRSQVRHLPEGFHVRGNLSATYAVLETLPKGLRVDGNLDISHTNVTSLPDDMFVGGSVSLNHTRVTALPGALSPVDGKLDISNSWVASIPDGFRICGALVAKDSEIAHIGIGVEVEGDVSLDGCRRLTTLGAFRPKKGLSLRSSPMTELPEDLRIDGDLCLVRSAIPVLPDGLFVTGNLDITMSSVAAIGARTWVHGDVFTGLTAIEAAPADMVIGGQFVSAPDGPKRAAANGWGSVAT